MIALVNGQPQTVTLKDMLSHYLDHQIVVIQRRTIYDLDKAQARAHILEGLLIALHDIDNAIEIIKCYASVIQQTLFEATNDRMVENIREGIREEAIEKIVQSAFYPTSDAVPQQISTVNAKRLYRAVQGTSTTLGAHLLGIFLLGSENELIQLQKSDPEFVDFVANMIQLRGHGNKQKSDFSRDDMESLKKNVFKAIKTISEVF